MQTFTDNASRTWTPAVNLASLKRLRAAGVDFGVGDGTFVQRLYSDAAFAADVAWHLIGDEAAKATGVNYDTYLGAMNGDTCVAARAAILANIEEFLPAKERATFKQMLATIDKAMDAAYTEITRRIEEIDIEQVVLDAMERKQ